MACERCGASLEGRRKGAKFCDASCRHSAWEKANPARAPQRATKASYNAPGRRSRRSGPRPPVRYTVWERGAGGLRWAGIRTARTRQEAIRQVGDPERYVAVAERILPAH